MTTMTETAAPSSRLEHFPISFFAVTMGLFGLALASRAAGLSAISAVIGWAAASVFALLVAVYAIKALRHPAAMKGEWNHPVRIAFFPAVSISLLLCATFLREGHADLAAPVWIAGAALQGVLTIAVLANWIGHRAFGPGHLSPAWFIPAVGNVVVPLAGVPLGHVEISWYFFSVGLLFWLILLTLVFNRLVFHDPLPGKLRPTLVILIAPPAVGFLAWLQLQGGALDATARLLINCGYLFTLLVLTQAPAFLRQPFALSFWALSFPVAAMAIASFRFAALAGSVVHQGIGWTLLGLLGVIVAALLLRTGLAMMRGEICQPE
ncbi:MAG: SLAC1 anion channel family protein [Hyphomicrobiaceae bacterium]|nr:SLAC1 anion channel family protein [Hyphomicrobiaceae bacterium]